MIAELTLCDGNPNTVNMDTVERFQPSDDHTMIVFVNGRSETVQESYDAVAELLNPER